MEVEKRSSKGGFLQWFDWNVKSRKQLFSNKSESPDGSKQEKENFEVFAMSRLPQMKVHGYGLGSGVSGSSDYNCASSLSGDEGCGTKAPGVVARLMGLDSLPTSNVSESSFTPFLDSRSFRDPHSVWSSIDFQSEHHIADYEKMRCKLDGFSINPANSRPQKVLSRPIERFQTEMLPPKSAKSIPITHHRLLSPIKSPGYIPTRNAAYIMEAAAKIIHQSPRSTTKGKLTSFGSSSVPLRIGDLKEKMEATQKASRLSEASQRSSEHVSVKYMRRQLNDRIQSGSEDRKLLKSSLVFKKGSSGSSKNKGNSVSLAVQAKVNVQRREGLTLSGNRSSANQKEDNKVKAAHYSKNQPNTQRSVQTRTSAGRTSGVLRQNNQKQNCASSKDRVSLKPLVSHQQDRKSVSSKSSRPIKTVNKVVVNTVIASRKMNSVITDSCKELSSSKIKRNSEMKRPVNVDIHFDGGDVDHVLIDKNERSVKCNVAVDGCTHWEAVDRKNAMDVVSFTFASPIKKSVPGPPSSLVMERNNSLCRNPYDDQLDSKKLTLSSLGLNVMGGDALSLLLERKLKELTCRVESSHCDLGKEGCASSSASGFQDSLSTLNEVNTMSMEHDKRFQLGLAKDKLHIQYDFNCSSVDELLLRAKQIWQGPEEMAEHSSASTNSEYEKELDCRYSSPESSLEPSFSERTCNSLDSKTSFSSTGSQLCLSAESHEVVKWISAQKPQSVEGETELSDSASSIFSFTNFEGSSCWELKYIGDILSGAELMLKDFALDQAHKFITPNIFEQLENQKAGSDKHPEHSKLGRKILFDCVSECLEFRCELHFGGSWRAWDKWTALLRRREWLAEELYKEISGWTSMEESMVDELVDKDMSTKYGKWIDFEIEAFEEGVEIEKGILTSLIDELIADFYLF